MGSGGTQWESLDSLTKERLNQKTVFIGTSEPSTTYAGMLWINSSTNVLNQRNSTDTGWIPVGALGKGLLSEIPEFGIPGRVYWATDTDEMYRDTGSAWEQVMASVALKAGDYATAYVGISATATGRAAYLDASVAAVKAKTDLIPVDNVTQLDTNIPAIKAKTDLIGASVALESAGNLAAVKAKTDNIPSDITTQLDTNVPAIKAKTDLIGASIALESGGNVAAVKAKTDLINGSVAKETGGILADIHDTDLPAVKTDTGSIKTTIDDIHGTDLPAVKTDTAAIKVVTDKIARLASYMDFWSINLVEVALTTTATADFALNSIVVAGIPTSATLIRVVAILKISLVKDTSAADNAVNGATNLKVDADSGYGSLVTAIDIPDNSWAVDVSEATERGGDVMIGTYDIKAEVTGNATFYARLENICCDGNNLKLKEIAWGLRVYFTI